MTALRKSVRNGSIGAALGAVAYEAASFYCLVQGGPLGAVLAQQCGQAADEIVTGVVAGVAGLAVGLFTGVRELRKRRVPAGESSGPPSR